MPHGEARKNKKGRTSGLAGRDQHPARASPGAVQSSPGDPTGLEHRIKSNKAELLELRTSLEQARRATQRERNRLEVVLGAIPCGVLILEKPDGRITHANERAIDLYGFDPRGIDISRHVSELKMLNADGQMYRLEDLPAMRALISGEAVHDEEMSIVRPDGIPVAVLVGAVPVNDEKGEIAAAIVVFNDITERRQMESDLKRSARQIENMVNVRTEQLTSLSRRLVALQEVERRVLARELHDEIGQPLTMLKMYLDKHAPTGPGEETDPRLKQARDTLQALMWQIRNLSLSLRPTMLDDLGLLPTLLWHFERYTAQTNVRVIFRHAGLRKELPPEAAITAYRIVQEALTNVARHASVNEVQVCVRREAKALTIEVEDHGAGFNLEEIGPEAGVGLSGMRERLLALGGAFKVESFPGRGTYVLGEVPLPPVIRSAATHPRKRLASKPAVGRATAG